MKVLLSAIACHPELGSEAKVGWDAAKAISQIPDVEQCHVMTHVLNREAILDEQAAARGASRLQFHFFGKLYRYHPNRMLARLQSWINYRNWQLQALERAAHLNRENGFHLAHHVTYASWRMPPLLWRLPLPFVFGPVGGGTTTPPAFHCSLGVSGRAFELLRNATTCFSARSRRFELCCAKSSAVVAADTPTADLLHAHGAEKVYQLCQVFFSKAEADRFTKKRFTGSDKVGELKLFAGGNLEARKGTHLALQALASLKSKGIPFSYTYGGWGPELSAMRKLAQELGIASQVYFHEGYNKTEYPQQLAKSHVYLLPSIRETAGITMMEATMAGCYPIVLAGTGAGDIVERVGGAAIKAKTPKEAVHKIAEALEWCYRQPAEMQQQAKAAGENIRQLYSESSYQEAISKIYKEAITRHAQRPQDV